VVEFYELGDVMVTADLGVAAPRGHNSSHIEDHFMVVGDDFRQSITYDKSWQLAVQTRAWMAEQVQVQGHQPWLQSTHSLSHTSCYQQVNDVHSQPLMVKCLEKHHF